jgi:hypothetical protein
MRILSLAAALIAASVSVVTTPATAGVWSLGCKGNIGDATLIFDRYALIMLPKKLANGDLRGLIRGNIDIFNLTSGGDGFQPTMEFTSGTYADQTITLTETDSRKISGKRGQVGTRGETTDVFRKTYRFKQVAPRASPEATIVMDCLEYQLTAP